MSTSGTQNCIQTGLGWAIQIDETDSLKLKEHQGRFETAETQLCKELIKPGDRVLDIGANIGYYTKLFAHHTGPSGSVHAFEPDADNLKILRQNLVHEVSLGTVQIHPVALGNRDQSATLFRHANNAGKHRLYPSVVCQADSAQISLKRGDDFNFGPVDFIKIDVEGYELEALQGLRHTVTTSPTLTMLIEFAPISMLEAGLSPKDLIQLLAHDLELHCFRHLRGAWTLVPDIELSQSMEPLNDLDISTLTRDLAGREDAHIEQKVTEYLHGLGFQYPLLENQLWVSSGALERTLHSLATSQPEHHPDWLHAVAPKIALGETRPISSNLLGQTTREHDETLGVKVQSVQTEADTQAGLLQKIKQTRWFHHWVFPEQSVLWKTLFSGCFKDVIPHALLEWKYTQNRGFGIGAYSGRGLVGFIGGMPREVYWNGQAVQAIQVCDVMVHPEFRHLQPKHGVFQQLAARFLSTQISSSGPFQLGFGFPSQRAFRLAERLKLYAPVDSMVRLEWPRQVTLRGYFSRSRAIQPSDASTVDELGEAMHRSFTASIIGKRNWAYVQTRYLEHPTHQYVCRLIVSQFTGQAQGVIILRQHEDGVAEWVDLIAPRDRFKNMVHATLRFSRRSQNTRLFVWVTNSHRTLFDIRSPKCTPLDIIIPAYDSIQAPAIQSLVNRWFLMSGDSDFH